MAWFDAPAQKIDDLMLGHGAEFYTRVVYPSAAMRAFQRLVCVALLGGVAACSHHGQRPPSRQTLAVPGVNGLSGLSFDPGGRLWMAPERDPRLVVREADGALSTVPLDGVPPGLDVESLAWVNRQWLMLGTEGNVAPSGTESAAPALILRAKLTGDGAATRVVVTGSPIELDPAPWGLHIRENQGVEGLCHAGNQLVAALETVGTDDRGRFAPLGVYDFASQRWRAYRMRLTSATGKLSALSCWARPGGIMLYAIERHFGVLRLLSAAVTGPGGDVRPRLLANLDDFAAQTKLNVEGLESGDGGTLFMVIDNQYKTITGPNELLTMPVPR